MDYPTLQEAMMERFSYIVVDINRAKYVIQGFIGTGGHWRLYYGKEAA